MEKDKHLEPVALVRLVELTLKSLVSLKARTLMLYSLYWVPGSIEFHGVGLFWD